jgi:hypothetical protein
MGRRLLRTHLAVWFVAVWCASPAGAFDGARAQAIVDTIASDAFQGRKSGLAGGRMIEEFVALRFRAWGLEGGGTDGGFFHEFPMLVTEERSAALELLDGPYAPLAFLDGDDFVLATNSGSGNAVAEVVLAGHGVSNARRGRDDYGDLDAGGKIVAIVREEPDRVYVWEPAISRDSTLEEALRRGAAGVLWLRGERAIAGGAVHEGSYRADIPLASIGERVLGHLLAGTGYDVKRYRSELAKGPLPLATGKRIRLSADVRLVENGSARNVAGIVRGSDPLLRGETIVVGAHGDHLGIGAHGLVYNGANDNASGTAVVMELARSFAERDPRPARTIVFVVFAAEEQGLLGSRAFVADPPIDLGAVVAMMNLDVEGHGNGKTGIGGAGSFPAIWRDFRESLGASLAESLTVGRAWGGESSDHAPFRDAGIPAMSIWSDGEHRFYHTIEDDPEWVTETILGSVGRMTERWILALADWKEPLLRPHRAGRAWLADSDQVDLDGSLRRDVPPFVRGAVRWFDAGEAGSEAFLDSIGNLRARAEGSDSIAVVSSIREMRGASRGGARAVLVGLRADEGSIPRARLPLLGPLGVGIASRSSREGEFDLESFCNQGIDVLLPHEAGRRPALPAGARAYVRFFPGQGEEIAEPDSFPRGSVLFLASLEAGADPRLVARAIRRLDWDRVHLDLVPWIALRNDEEGIAIFLEELRDAGGFEPREMRALLGENLARW